MVSGLRPVMQTRAPRAETERATARPMPRVAPVMRTFLPVRPKGLFMGGFLTVVVDPIQESLLAWLLALKSELDSALWHYLASQRDGGPLALLHMVALLVEIALPLWPGTPHRDGVG